MFWCPREQFYVRIYRGRKLKTVFFSSIMKINAVLSQFNIKCVCVSVSACVFLLSKLNREKRSKIPYARATKRIIKPKIGQWWNAQKMMELNLKEATKKPTQTIDSLMDDTRHTQPHENEEKTRKKKWEKIDCSRWFNLFWTNRFEFFLRIFLRWLDQVIEQLGSCPSSSSLSSFFSLIFNSFPWFSCG